MITSMYSNSPYIKVAAPPIPYVTPGSNAGQMRWNTQMNQMEVCNGASWQVVGGAAAVSTTAEFDMIIEWARGEMAKSDRIKKLAAESATVADALATLEDAAEKLQVIMALADKEIA